MADNPRYNNSLALAEIFVEEKDKESLFRLLQAESGDLYFTDCFARHLSDAWPQEVLESYVKGVLKLAERTGRPIYQEVAKYLKKMRRINGGDKAVGSLVREFREKYKNRRAFMEILKKSAE